jgi:hypothetical protein
MGDVVDKLEELGPESTVFKHETREKDVFALKGAVFRSLWLLKGKSTLLERVRALLANIG